MRWSLPAHTSELIPNCVNICPVQSMNQLDRDAAQKGDLRHFQALAANTKLETLVLSKDEDGRSLLHIASTSGSLPVVELIADRGGRAVVNDTDDEGWTPLMSAVSAGQEATAAFLISIGAEVDKANSGGRAAMHYAASKGNVGMLRLLLQSGAKVNRKDSTGSTPLHRAASAGKAEAVRVLVEEGHARLEEEDKQGQTPLFVSVESGHKNVAMYLASKGADLEAATKEGETPLSVADSTLRGVLLSAHKQQQEEDMHE